VTPGGSAAFEVRFDENCFHDETSGLRYRDGVLYVDGVLESQSLLYAPKRKCTLTVRQEDAAYLELLTGSAALSGETAQIRVNPPAHYLISRVHVNEDVYSVPPTGTLSFRVYGDSLIRAELEGEPVAFSLNSGSVGAVLNLTEREAYRYGETVTLRLDRGASGVRFDGWSTGAYLSEGGTPLSAQEEISLTLLGDTDLYANFTDLHTYTVTIDPNGGYCEPALILNDLSAGKPVYLPADRGVLRRDGYALIGYNTLPDGSGQRFALSSPMLVGHENATVYAQWLPETPGDALSYYTIDG
jgi:hypothetical protein